MLVRIPEIGSRLIKSIPRLGNVARIILYQNKLFDGSGFPRDSVSGSEIPEGSRKLKIFSDLIHLESKGLSRRLAFEKMKSLKGRYDEVILDRVIAYSKDNDENVVEEKGAITFAELKEGNLLASDIESTDGMRIAAAGCEISQLLLEKLENFNCMVGLKEPIYIKVFVEKR